MNYEDINRANFFFSKYIKYKKIKRGEVPL